MNVRGPWGGTASRSVIWNISGEAAEKHCASCQFTEERKREALNARWPKFTPWGKSTHSPGPFGKLLERPDPRPCDTGLFPSLDVMGGAESLAVWCGHGPEWWSRHRSCHGKLDGGCA